MIKSAKTKNGNYYTPYERMNEEQRKKVRDYQKRVREENKNNIEWQLRQAIYNYRYYEKKISKLKALLQSQTAESVGTETEL
jgi:hypothetical protein